MFMFKLLYIRGHKRLLLLADAIIRPPSADFVKPAAEFELGRRTTIARQIPVMGW
jgi:hypothetical protein